MPALAQLAAAADVGDRDRDAAIEQAQPVRGKRHRVGDPVGAVAGEQERARAVARRVRRADERDRHAGAVGRGRVEALGAVARGVEAAEHLGPLQERARARVQVLVEHRRRRDERLVAEAVAGRRELGVALGRDLVGGLGERDVVGGAVGQAGHAQAQEPVRALQGDPVPGEHVHALEHHVVAVREALRPPRRPRVVRGRGDEAEVAPSAAVGADVEEVAARPGAVVDVVLVVGLAGQDHPPRAAGVGRGQAAHLGAREARRGGEEPAPAARALHVQPEKGVGLLVDQLVGRRAEAVAPEPVGALGVVLGHVEEDVRLGGPRDRRDALDALGRELARGEVLDVQRVLTEAGDVGRVREAAAVVGHPVGAERHERVTLGQAIQVERHLLGRLRAPRPAAVDRVLLALLRPRVVGEAAERDGHGRVVLLDPREHLLVERALERRGRRHRAVGVRVLGLEVRAHLGVVLGAEPRVAVLAALAVDHRHGGRAPGDGRARVGRRRHDPLFYRSTGPARATRCRGRWR